MTTEPSWYERRGLPSRAALASRPHGTRLRYLGGCKCVPCRAANSRYESERQAARKRGESNGVVSADPARRHLDELRRLGVGCRAVESASGVARSIIQRLGAGTQTRCRADTVRRILEVDETCALDSALVDAEPTRRKVARLLEEGFTKRALARRFGLASPALQFPLGDKITIRNAAKVDRLWRALLMDMEE